MTDHYFSNNPQSKTDPKVWTYSLRGNVLKFMTDHGVFSKQEVDFGSRLLIETFKEPDVDGDLLDVGCGYGPIGLSLAATFPKRTITMVDVNERALSLAEENAGLNNIDNVKVLKSDVYEQVEHHQYAAILTNPPIRAGKKVVHKILEDAKQHLVTGGQLWVVIQKKQGAPSALEKMETVYGNVEVVSKSKGYYILKAEK